MQFKGKAFLAAAIFFGMFGCTEQKKDLPNENASHSKSMIVFYSQNGTTKSVALEFQKNTGATIWELQMEKAYPSTYDSTISAVKAEREEKRWPKLLNANVDMANVDTLYVGYPIMFGTFAPPIYTFLDSNDLSGKVVIPFCTYGSGGMQAAARELQALEPNARVGEPFGISHKRAEQGKSPEEVTFFLKRIFGKTAPDTVAYSEARPLNVADSTVFALATKDYAYLHLEPVQVSSRIALETSYIFFCQMTGPDKKKSRVKVHVLCPKSEDGGEPEMLRVDRE